MLRSTVRRPLLPLLGTVLLASLLVAVPALAAVTGDPRAGDQWHLDAVQVPLAWDEARGDGVVVAVLDSGITPGPDLACREFVAEYDATTGDEGPVEDTSGHGTHVAGTIAQCSGNGTGWAGVAPDVSLMDVKVLTGSPTTSTASPADLADGILFAAENGADVINISIAAPCTTTYDGGCRFLDVDAAIAVADGLGVTILAAAGNDGSDLVSYPANHPDVIAVGSVDAALGRPSYATGGDALDHVAPGGAEVDADGDGRIDSIDQEGYDPDADTHGQDRRLGSSHAVAHSSGIAALLLSADPDLSPDDVRSILSRTACDLGPDGTDDASGAGLVRAADALAAAVDGIGLDVCFFDVTPANIFFADVSRLAQLDITRGCTSNGNRFCPGADVTRGEMAAFLNRALDLPASSTDFFRDDDTSVFEDDINAVAAAGITVGCNPSTGGDRFCPEDSVTRGQMAAFLDRAFDLPATSTDFFRDDDGSIFEDNIDRIAAAGITKGCNPPTNDRFCPVEDVSRQQMAAFLVRAVTG